MKGGTRLKLATLATILELTPFSMCGVASASSNIITPAQLMVPSKAATPAVATASANSVSFVRIDSTTSGNWIGNYGADGYFISQDSSTKTPTYAQMSFTNASSWLWANSPGGWIAPQKPENPADRIAGQWFSNWNFSINVNLTDGNTHQLALYALDYDSLIRGETINVYDAITHSLLDTRTLSPGSYHTGAYLIWNVKGNVIFSVTNNAGANATISAIFFGGAPSTPIAPITALPAKTFLSSLGINTHMSQGYPEAQFEPMFRYTGIPNDRDCAAVGSMTLFKNTGVLTDCISSSMSYLLSTARSLANAGALLAVEGPNEPNIAPITYNGQLGGGSSTWVPVALFQRDLYASVKADPVLKNYPVFSVSETGAEWDNVGLQFLTIPSGAGTVLPAATLFADYANLHNYITGRNGFILSDNQAWDAADHIASGWLGHDAIMDSENGLTWLKGYVGYSIPQLMTLPVVTTETGWPTQGTGAISEEQQGKLYLDVFAAQFKRGFRYTFIYQMIDNQPDVGLGIFHADSTPKLAATYIHNFTTILADQSNFTAGTLDYFIPFEPATVHDLLLQKSNGNFYLIVWDERASGATDMVNVQLAYTKKSISVFDPTVGTAPIQALTNTNSVPLTLSDHPLILAISPN